MSKKLDITRVVENYLCHSCGACFASCGHDSISFSESIGGYYFPKIDYVSCTGCGLCFDVCSGDHFGRTLQANVPVEPFIGDILSCEVGKAKDNAIFQNSQSGGVTTALLANLFDSGVIELAIVAIMREDTPPRGDYALVRSSKVLFASQKSKYTPIPLLRAIREIKNVNGTIAIVGLSCHFHGLQNLCDVYKWLAKKDIIKIGLICDRVMTTGAIDFIAMQATEKPVKKFVFRDKQKPSYPGNPTVTTVDDKEYVLGKSVRMSMKDFFTPARCRLCFDKLNVYADVVLGDPHGVENVDSKNGETLIITRTQKGSEIISKAKKSRYIILRDADKKSVIEGQGIAKKKKEWVSYVSAWKEMGRITPNYPFTPELTKEFKKEKKHLLHALSLDEYSSKNELLADAQKHYKSKKVKNLVKMQIAKVKNILKRG